MALRGLVRHLQNSNFIYELAGQLQKQRKVTLRGANRLGRALAATALARHTGQPLLLIVPTLEDATQWSLHLETMGWPVVNLYPTSEASPYEPFDPEEELTWGQLQVLALLCHPPSQWAIVTTDRALQPHLPPVEVFKQYEQHLEPGDEQAILPLTERLTELGYQRASQVEREGQFARRGDILDLFPVAAEMPVRLEWFGEQLERIREFDPATQRSLDAIPGLDLTAVSFGAMLLPRLQALTEAEIPPSLQASYLSHVQAGQVPEGWRNWLGLAFDQPASLVDYLPAHTLVVLDEPAICALHCDRWVQSAEERWQPLQPLPRLHRAFGECVQTITSFSQVQLTEVSPGAGQLGGRGLNFIPHQFASMAKTLRELRQDGFSVWILSAQPSRTVSLFQEHDCPAQFVPNPQDYPALTRLVEDRTPIALKYSGLADFEGQILATLRIALVTDRELYGQHVLATASYIRKRRRAASKQLDLHKLKPGDFVVHRQHGIGKFTKLETLDISGQSREYLTLQYEDGLLRVAADQIASLSRYRTGENGAPALSKLSSKTWERVREKVKKAVKKIAFDLLALYARRAQETGYAFPPDQPWQQELEESFPYELTPDQAKAIQEVKRDLESPRPMDRLVCGDVGFGKTEVALRAVFKALVSGKQCAVLAPTTILTQQHYHTFRDRFAPYPIRLGLLNRFRSPQERKELLRQLKCGELDLVIGTHQLLSQEVKFKDLGLLVIDEEQRFGVAQKEKIKLFKAKVDVLTLTATPIPRTLYMALSGVREMSIIATPPPSRRPIKTNLSVYSPEVTRTAIMQELERGGQVFYVYNRVEGIEEAAGRLRELVPSARIALAHGQMDDGELEAAMLAFAEGSQDVMVCTTIIESGLDIPRVNTILVENANLFGLAQLYQLRGRVGRSGVQAYAWLFYRQEETLSDTARKRLRAIQEFTQLGSGYQLAMRDLEIRGSGNLLGSEQSGQVNSVGFDLYMEMLEEAIREIRGQEVPQVDDTQIDLSLTAFIPATYIADTEQKMSAYRQLAALDDLKELHQLETDWIDRLGPLPVPVQQLFRVMTLKLLARGNGFSRIRPEGANIVLETQMAAPAWEKLSGNLSSAIRARFVHQPGKVTVKGLGAVKTEVQLESLTTWLGQLQGVRVAG
ncbi:transcription-repair coupling factor [Candidatus Cyanaurora vandensis]|uniref:transcription-repair coupling factor n=1 Tax=Candidatus Cyanaurora vandensis TaxID=2714958 RepID=UPI00257BFE30|nr:transcription-repair coupling factor [Candidatus Cyanaurora vandensis]